MSMSSASTVTFVARQRRITLPATKMGVFLRLQATEHPEEEELCNEAMEGCPVEAIGDNGEDA